MWTCYLILKDLLAILVILLTEYGIQFIKRTASGKCNIVGVFPMLIKPWGMSLFVSLYMQFPYLASFLCSIYVLSSSRERHVFLCHVQVSG